MRNYQRPQPYCPLQPGEPIPDRASRFGLLVSALILSSCQRGSPVPRAHTSAQHPARVGAVGPLGGGDWTTDWDWADETIIGDFTGDGMSDVIARHHDASVVFRSEGDGTFTQLTGVQDGWPYSEANTITLMDFDGDRKMDVLARRLDDDDVTFFRSNGDGTFTRVAGWDSPPSHHLDLLIPLDFNGDHKADLLTYDVASGTASLYRSLGNGAFKQVPIGWNPWLFWGVDRIIPLDFNGDGRIDLLGRRSSNSTAAFFRSEGDGSFAQVGDITQWPYQGADEFLPGDFDGDGDLDILARRRSDNAAVFYRGNGDGTFYMRTPWTTQWPLGSDEDRVLMFVNDYNHDGKSDVFVVRNTDNTAVLMLADGKFEFSMMAWMIYWPDTSADDFRVGDFDGNQRPDFLVHRSSDGARSLLKFQGWEPAAIRVCNAIDRISLLACVQDIDNYDEVSIDSDIECYGNDCCGPTDGSSMVTVTDAKNKTLRGNGNRIIRHSMQAKCHALSLIGGEDITLRDISFEEVEEVPTSGVPAKIPLRMGPIEIHYAQYVTLENVTVLHAKGVGIEVLSSDHVTIRHSRVIGSGLLGISFGVVNDEAPSSFATVTETDIADTATNGLALDPVAGIADTFDNVVSGNLFLRNHNHGMYLLCAPEDQPPCGGGQIYPGSAKHLAVVANTVGNGYCDNCLDNSVFGIEAHKVEDGLFRGNYLYNNSDCGIWHDKDWPVTIENNGCKNNGGCVSTALCCPESTGCEKRTSSGASADECQAPMVWCDCTQSCINQFFCTKKTDEGKCF